jgi:predicted MPP superfamily phosphohydrolase
MHQLLDEPSSRTIATRQVQAQGKEMSRRAFLRRAGMVAILPVAGTVWAREVEPFWLDLHEIPLTIPGLPRAFDGLRVAQLTDLHMDEHVPMAYLRRVIDRVNAAKPDLVLVTGDVVNHTMEWIEPAAQLLAGLEAPKFVSFGNHDYVPWHARPGPFTIVADPLQHSLERAGCRVLRNRSASIERRGEKLWIVGIEDLWSTRFSPADAFDGLDGRKQTILAMSHNPDSAEHVVPYFPKLILAGHTHGGQLRVPLLGAPLLPIVDRRFDQGLFALDSGCQMYVSRGVGFLMRARFCCRPEVPIFVMSSAS